MRFYEQSFFFSIFYHSNTCLFPSVLVRIGGMLGMTLGIDDYRHLLTYSHPNKFTLALAEKLYGLEQLATATVTREDSNKQLVLQITRAIKSEVLRVFGSSLSIEEQAK